MTKKLSLLLAFLGKPALILLDEPFTTLDQAGRAVLDNLIEDRHLRSGASFLISSHQEIGPDELPSAQYLAVDNGRIILKEC